MSYVGSNILLDPQELPLSSCSVLLQCLGIDAVFSTAVNHLRWSHHNLEPWAASYFHLITYAGGKKNLSVESDLHEFKLHRRGVFCFCAVFFLFFFKVIFFLRAARKHDVAPTRLLILGNKWPITPCNHHLLVWTIKTNWHFSSS